MQLKAEAAGIAYPENFFADPGQWAGPAPPPPPPPPRPSPDTLVLADVERAKIAAKARGDAEELTFRRAQAAAKIASDERIAREKNYWDRVLADEKFGIDRAKVTAAVRDGEAPPEAGAP